MQHISAQRADACYNRRPMDSTLISPRQWPVWAGLGVLRLVVALPLRVQVAIGNLLGSAYYRLSGRRRHIASTNLQLCFPELGPEERKRLVRHVFKSTGIGVVETAMAYFKPLEPLRPRVRVEGLEHLTSAQARGRGVILVGAHFVSLDLAGGLLSLFADIDVMYRRGKNPVAEYVMRRGREQYYGAVIERSDTRTILRRLRENRTIWYAADQDYGRKHSVFAPFFGQQAATITATSRLARFNQSPALFISQFRDARTLTWSLHISPILDDFPSGDDVADATRINALIEQEIRRHPEQYLWIHRRFKTRPPGEPRPY
jgi:Kdo2-lipid IVA lauroyltransferase/acyltransferase